MSHNVRRRRRHRAFRMAAIAVPVAALLGVSGSTPAAAHDENSRTTFYEHGNNTGGWLDVDAGAGVSDLRSRHTCWFWCPNFNDRISSVETGGSAALLYEHINYSGEVLCVAPHMRVDLPWNWNDRVSSVYVVWGSTGAERDCPPGVPRIGPSGVPRTGDDECPPPAEDCQTP